MNRISVPAPLREEPAAITADGYPCEACGVLAGACADGAK